ncbi:MAG: GNAT family N-acetyltransferase [Acidobacteriota bacterium]
MASMKTASAHFTLRPAEMEDEAFLFELYRSTREEEISRWGWDEAQKQAFLSLQFRGQQQHYQLAYQGADHLIIMIAGRAAGRLMTLRTESEIRLVDIALLPEHRGKGIGERLMRDLQQQARESGKPLRLHVERFNRAARFYHRLGFRVIEDRGTHFFMQWDMGGTDDY